MWRQKRATVKRSWYVSVFPFPATPPHQMMGIILESCNLPEPAVEHFKRGAEAGCATSMFMYARRIMATNGHDLSTPEGKVVREGDGLEVLTALTWLKKAADGLVSDDDGTEVMLEGCEEALCFALFYQACILQDCPGLLEDSVIEQDEALTCLNKILDIVPSCSYRKQIDLQIKARLRSAVDSSPKGADENPLATKSAHTACDDHVEADVVECTAEEEKSATATPAPEEAPVQPAPPSGRCLRWRKLIDSGDAGTAAEEIRVEAEKGDGEALMVCVCVPISCNTTTPDDGHHPRKLQPPRACGGALQTWCGGWLRDINVHVCTPHHDNKRTRPQHT